RRPARRAGARARPRGARSGRRGHRSRGRGDAVSPPTGGEWVVRALAQEGVRHVFGIPGIHNLAIYDALLRQSAIGHVLARHEQGAAFMADGYARASGTPGVVVVTSGPAATNTLTPPSTGRRPPCHVADVEAAARRLRTAARPLVITGGGVVAAGAAHELAALVRRLGAPVVSTVSGRGALDERDSLWHSVLPDR